jgi:phenylalanyl-tRNA synthetase beta chain
VEESSFYQLKSFTENILKKLGFNLERLTIEDSENELFSDALLYHSGNRKKLVEIGMVANQWLKKFGLSNPVYYADFDWGQLFFEHRKNKITFNELPKYPAVRRDLALLVDKSVKFGQIKELAFKNERQILHEVILFDVYEGQGIPDDKKSYAVSYILRDDIRTLNDKQIDKVMDKLVEVYGRELGAQLR